FDLVLHPGEAGLLDETGRQILAVLTEVPHLHVEAIAPGGSGRGCCRSWSSTGLLLDEGVGQVGPRHLARSSKRQRLTGRVLLVEARALCLLVQVCWQVLASEDGLQVIRQQQTLRTGAVFIVVHDPALEAL